MAKTAGLAFRIEDDLKRALEDAAASDERSVSGYVVRILRARLTADGYLPKAVAKPAARKQVQR
jgi:uncharacterized protein (DUF1778 family)